MWEALVKGLPFLLNHELFLNPDTQYKSQLLSDFGITIRWMVSLNSDFFIGP